MGKLNVAAALFGRYIGEIGQVAAEYGYAIGVHGSLSRDIDLIAVPWVEKPAHPETLVHAIASVVNGQIYPDSPKPKCHGRSAWGIALTRDVCIDLSVFSPYGRDN